MTLKILFRLIVGTIAAVGLLACDASQGGSGSGIIRLVNPLMPEISVSVQYPNGSIQSVLLNRRISSSAVTASGVIPASSRT